MWHVNKIKKITGFLLLAIYSMVILHNIVPHFHLNSDTNLEISANFSDHSDHHHSHDHDHEEDTEIDFFHSIGHLLGDGFHAHEGLDHLTHVPTDYKASLSKLKVYYVVLLSFVPPVNETLEKENEPSFSPPSYERCLFTATPLRAPPALV